jgi:hypothetical protein
LHPSSADVSLLRAALSEGEVARAAYRAWREQFDWDCIPPKWKRLIPLLHHNVTALGIKDPLIRRLRGIRRYLWARNLGLMDLTKRVHVAFADVKVPVLALKGTSLIASGYLDRSIRPMEDIDVLVNRSHFDTAISILKGLGFEPYSIRPRCLIERVVPTGELPSWPFRNAEGKEVDLHWNALHLDRRPEADSDAWHRSRHVIFEGISIRVLDPSDQLLQICAHGIQAEGPDTIGWIADAICVIRGAELDWEAFLQRSAYHRLSASLADALASLSKIVSLPFPDELLRRLRKQSSFEEKIESKLRRHDQPASASYLERAALAAALYRRGRPELFDGTLFPTIRSWMKSAMGTRTVIEASGRYLYWRLGHPSLMRKLIAPDRAISLPPASQLPLLDGGVDATTDEAPESLFIHGWSISERAGRWTDGPLCVLAWRLAVPANAETQIRIFGTPAISGDHRQIRVSVFLADNRVAFCEYNYAKAPPPCIAFGIPEHLRSQGTIIMLTLEIKNPLIQAQDIRALGFFLQKIEISNSGGALISTSSTRDTSLTRPNEVMPKAMKKIARLLGQADPPRM